MKSGDNFKLLYDLADKLGAAGMLLFISSIIFVFGELELTYNF